MDRERFLSGFSPLPEGLPLPPSFLETYEVVSCLSRKEGNGGVWRLSRRADGAAFVLKAVPAGTEDLAEAFQILTRLWPLLPRSVPEPVSLFSAGELDCLVRAYLPGETLEAGWEAERSAESCIRLGKKLCALLEVLHSQDPPVIHRDIKPENIILLPDGEVGLIDFGIARQYKDGQSTDTRRMGTRSTAAPEQYGYAQTDRRTDLYALGMTLIWYLTGRYDRDALAGRPDLPRRLRKALERAVAFAPESRFQDAAAFSRALAGKPSRRKRAALALALLLLAAGAWFLRPAAPPPETPPAGTAAHPDGTETSPAETAAHPDGTERSPAETEARPDGTETPPAGAEAQPVAFSSAAMEAAVRQALGKPAGAITYDELSAITRLAVVGGTPFGPEQDFDYRIGCYVGGQYQSDLPFGDAGDEDLALLAHMPHLEELYLCRQEIRDVSALAGLPLTALALCENEILDVSPLGTLTELETLYLGGNPATDYGSLASLTRLETLVVEGSGTGGLAAVESLRFLDSLTVRKLGLGLTVPRDGDWSPLSRQTTLEELLLWDPGAEALTAAGALSQLKALTIGDYYADDLTALAGLSGLEVLNIHKGSVASLAGIESLTRLLTLSVGYNGVTDLTPLAGLPRLNYLQLEGLAVADFSPLSGLPELGFVVVSQDQAAAVEADCPGHAFELRTV